MMQQSHRCLAATPYRKGNGQKQTHTSCSGRPLLQQLLWVKQCQHFAAKVTQSHSAVTLSKGTAIPVNLSVMLLQHLICLQPPRGLHMTEWRIWAQTQRGNISVGCQPPPPPPPPPPHPQSWDFSWNFLSLFRLSLLPKLEENIKSSRYATSAAQSNSLSCGI